MVTTTETFFPTVMLSLLVNCVFFPDPISPSQGYVYVSFHDFWCSHSDMYFFSPAFGRKMKQIIDVERFLSSWENFSYLSMPFRERKGLQECHSKQTKCYSLFSQTLILCNSGSISFVVSGLNHRSDICWPTDCDAEYLLCCGQCHSLLFHLASLIIMWLFTLSSNLRHLMASMLTLSCEVRPTELLCCY